MAFNLSVTIGPAVGGLLASRSYLPVYLADAVITLVGTGIVALVLPDTKRDHRRGRSTRSWHRRFLGMGGCCATASVRPSQLSGC